MNSRQVRMAARGKPDKDTTRNSMAGHGHNGTAAPHPSFGEKLRAYRELHGVSLKELSQRAEISIGILSQIERGMNSPSLRTLTKVRTALGLPSSFFFDDDHPATDASSEADFVCRADERPQLHLGKGGIRKELLHHNASRVFEFMMVQLPPRSNSGTTSYPSEKGGMVVEGEVVVTVGERSTTLQEGDSLLFDGLIPHTLENRTDWPATLLWIIAKLPNNLLV